MKISVVMTTYNGENYLEQQIKSILNQTLIPAELIVCDDGSTDNTITILEKYKKQGQLYYVVNPQRLGLIDNFKKTVSLAAKGNYIALSDQDDEWMPDKLEKSAALLATIDSPQYPCMVYTDLLFVDKNENILNTSFRNELGQDKYCHNLQTLLFGNFVNGCTVLMNQALSKLFVDIPNNVRLNHDGWIALVAFTFGKAATINAPLVRYKKHSANLSIAVDTKPRNRYISTLNQLIDAIKGKDSFLEPQFETVKNFYNKYASEITVEKKQYFEAFLKLEGRPYIYKKIAFRKIVKEFKRKTKF
ncbi:MAG: glycosyltransferase [Bacteroidota bacterium]